MARGNDTPFRVTQYLRDEFGSAPGAAKLLARLAGCSHRTTEKWLQGIREPTAGHLTELMRHPRFRDGFLPALDATRR